MQDFSTSIKHASHETVLNMDNIFRKCILCVRVHTRVCVWKLTQSLTQRMQFVLIIRASN